MGLAGGENQSLVHRGRSHAHIDMNSKTFWIAAKTMPQ